MTSDRTNSTTNSITNNTTNSITNNIIDNLIDTLDYLTNTLERNNVNMTDICACLDNIVEITNNLTKEDIEYIINNGIYMDEQIVFIYDLLISDVHNEHNTEIIEKTSYLLTIIKQPKELVSYLEEIMQNNYFPENSNLTSELYTSALMLMFVLQKETNCYFENFTKYLIQNINKTNVKSEGFLFFILQVIENNSDNADNVLNTQIVDKLITLCLTQINSSKTLTKVLYVILVILRMNYAVYKKVKIERLEILTKSFTSIKDLVERIFVEARNPWMRPKGVFLQNFTFPGLEQ